MSRDRYVLLGLGRSRSTWFGSLALWTTSGALPAEFHKCLSAMHVRQRLDGLQLHSALIVEEGIADIDRDLIEAARRADCPTFVISDTTNPQAWIELGAVAVLPTDLNPTLLLQALSAHSKIISASRDDESAGTVDHLTQSQGRLIAVCGAGGTGASTIAIATAQALAEPVTETDHVVLADFARNSEQAMLHDSPDITPSVEEAVELHRHRRPTIGQIRDTTFAVDRRGYRLLLGQRRVGAWTALPPAAVLATVAGLRRAFRTVVADITADFESEADGGSLDVEERNALARLTAANADIVLVVGTPDFKGIHALGRTMRHVGATGVSDDRIVPIITRAPKHPLRRAEISQALSTLSTIRSPALRWNAPVFLPDKPIENALRDGTAVSKHFTKPLAALVHALEQQRRAAARPTASITTPERLRPGSLGLGDHHRAVGE
jgi:hypothetical protein